jgi:hypothetical protein
MKISELVELLEEYKEKLGDVEVYTLDCDYHKEIHEAKEDWYSGVCIVIE